MSTDSIDSYTLPGPDQGRFARLPNDTSAQQGMKTSWPMRVLLALFLTLASNLLRHDFRHPATFSDQHPNLMRRDYCKWDCGYYAGVADHGYEPRPLNHGTTSWHFLPMFSLAIVPAVHLFHIESLRATVLMSKVFLFTAILAFLWMLGDELSGTD